MSECLQALSFPNRLHLLTLLGEGRTIDEIELQPAARHGEHRSDRVLTRQGIRHHLDQLREVGLVTVTRENEDGRLKNTYQMAPASLFDLSEGIREMGRACTSEEPGSEGAGLSWTGGLQVSRPRLIVAHGFEIGRAHPLENRSPEGKRGWVLGGTADVDIPLKHDPQVQGEVGEIDVDDEGFHVRNLRTSTCPLAVNGTSVELGSVQRLQNGDLVGVGRSLLALQT